MSGMGWFTESSILPKQSRKIIIDDSSLVSCKAVMSQLKQKYSGLKTIVQKGQNSQNNKQQQKQVKRNNGIQERIKKDQEQSRTLNQQKSFVDVRKQLIKKQQTYDVMKKSERNHSQFLTDFSIKSLLEVDDEFQLLKKQFYEGKLNDVIKQQDKLHDDQEKGYEEDLRERLTWQRDVLNELKGDVIEQKEKVVQSFDRRLTNQQKQALEKVLQQKLIQKKRYEDIRKRRINEEQGRVRKLIKMNAYEESEQQDKNQPNQKQKAKQTIQDQQA